MLQQKTARPLLFCSAGLSNLQGSTLTFEDRTGAKPVLFKIGGLREGDECTVPANLTVKAHAFTETARAAIEGAGGKCVVMNKYGRVLGEEVCARMARWHVERLA